MANQTLTRETDMADVPARKAGLTRFIPLVVIVAALGAFFGLGLDKYISLETLKTYRGTLVDFANANPVLGPIALAGIYAVLVAISFPGASLLTIFAGFMFGTLIGGTAVLVGATVGAAAIFLAARTALGESLRAKAGPWLKRFEEGFKESAFSYLLLLRLVPAFPFWLVNLAPALLGVGLKPYVAATFLGIIPGTFVYASVGAGAGAIIDAGQTLELSGLLLKPEVLIPIVGLAVLALIPVVVKAVRRKRA